MTPTQESMNVFDDEFAVDDFDFVADGFRPGNASEGDERHSQDPPIHTVSAHYATDPDLITPAAVPKRNSISKPTSNENPFSSPDDEPRMEFERSPSMHSQSTASFAPGIARRSTSSASSNLFASTHSPRFDGGGPSHPYAMYPQGTLPRSPSIATTSTVQPNRTSSVRHAPQHPYAMYPQGVAEDDDLDEEAPAVAPAVGFPGLGQQYQRVRGPDGEEQDIVGVDGHTEQLPPYTRYPEDGPKMPILAVPGELHSRGPVAGSDPGMPLMHHHVQPPPDPPMPRQSMTDQSNLDRHSVQDRGVDTHASLPLMERTDSEDTGFSEKSWKEKSWKEKRKTKFCGVPLLWLIMAACAAGFIGAIVGGIMGGYASGSKHAKEKSDAESSSSSSVAEARRIATPTVSAPTGTYALSLSTPTNVQSGCLSDPNYNQAWDCDLSGTPALAISVGVPAAPRPTVGAFFFYASTNDAMDYGAQYRFMDTDFAPFEALQESGDEDQGPAFYFSQKYDKIVVLPETAFGPAPTGSPSRVKRAEYQLPPGWNRQKQTINKGERPWMCVWNDTLIEGWIYVEKPVVEDFPVTTTSSSPVSIPTNNSMPAGTTLSSYTSSPTVLVSGDPVKATDVWTSSDSLITTTVTKTSVAASATSEPWAKNRGPHQQFDDDHSDDDGQTISAKVRRKTEMQRRDTPGEVNDEDDDDDENEAGLSPEEQEALDTYHGLDIYPYLIKIEERRVPEEGNTPYCQQFQLLNDGTLQPTTSNGQYVRFEMAESPPEYTVYDSQDGTPTQKLRAKRMTPSNGCHCEWWSQ